VNRFVPTFVCILAAIFAVVYVFEIGRSTEHQIDREQIKAAYKACHAIEQQNSGSIGTKIDGSPCQNNTNNGSEETPEISAILRTVAPGEALLGIVTLLLAAATLQLVLDGRQHSKRELRAYVSVKPRGVKPLDGAGPLKLIGTIRIRNVGKIPAHNISIFSTIEWCKSGARPDFVPKPLTDATISLHPRTWMEFGTYSAYELDKIERWGGEYLGFLYVWGRITYTDDFGTLGWTNFCHRYPCIKMNDFFRIRRRWARFHELSGNEAD
jgi:hypothetical protein